jgi:hypothetical protein
MKVFASVVLFLVLAARARNGLALSLDDVDGDRPVRSWACQGEWLFTWGGEGEHDGGATG